MNDFLIPMIIVAMIISVIYYFIKAIIRVARDTREWTNTLQQAGFTPLQDPNSDPVFEPYIRKMTVFQQGKRIGFRREPALGAAYARIQDGEDILVCSLWFNTGLAEETKSHSQSLCLFVGSINMQRLPYFHVLPRGVEIEPRVHLVIIGKSLDVEERRFEGANANQDFTKAYVVSTLRGDQQAELFVRNLFSSELQVALLRGGRSICMEAWESGLAVWLHPHAPPAELLPVAEFVRNVIRCQADRILAFYGKVAQQN